MTVKFLARFILCISVFILACCSVSPIKNFRIADPRLIEIFNDAENFNNRVVTFRAWISLRSEDKNLWATQEDHQKWNFERCISLIGYNDISEKNKISDGAYVQVTGIIVRDGSEGGSIIRLAACRDLSIKIDRNSFLVLER